MSSTLNVYNKQQFNDDVSFNSNTTFNNTNTVINSIGLVNICGGIVNISGDSVNIAAGGNIKFCNGFTNTVTSYYSQTFTYTDPTITGGNGIFSTISPNGNMIALSDPKNSILKVYSLNNTNGTWSQLGQTITNTNAGDLNGKGGFGWNVQFSANGIMVVAAVFEGSNTGVIYIYYYNTSTSQWTIINVDNEKGSNLSSIYDQVPSSYNGFGLAISNDGSTLAFGSNAWVNVKIYTYNSSTNKYVRVLPSTYTAATCSTSVALSDNGNVLAVGIQVNGTVNIYRRTTGTIWNLNSSVDILSPGGSAAGGCVCLSGDGNILSVSSLGSTYIYKYNGSSWGTPNIVSNNLSPLENGLDRKLMELSKDGKKLFMCGNNSNYSAFLYYENNGNGNEYVSKTFNVVSTDLKVTAVSMSYDGTKISLGDTTYNSNNGKTSIYSLVSSNNYAGKISMTITKDGYVGIGTTTPSYKLDVSGGIECINLTRCYEPGYGKSNNYFDIGTESSTNHGNFLYGYGNKQMTFGTNGTARMAITAAGNVGIGTESPSYKLDVNGTTNLGGGANIQGGYLSIWGGNGLTINSNGPINNGSGSITCGPINTQNNSISCGTMTITGVGHSEGNSPIANNTYGWINSTSIQTSQYAGAHQDYISLSVTYSMKASWQVYGITFYAYSDSRIKTNIVDIDDSSALSILRKIQPKTYDYVDKIKKGNDNVIGFIAEEIKAILPKAVTISKDYIPNFYTNCIVSTTDVSNIVVVTSPIDLSWNPLHDPSGNAFIDEAGNASSDASGKKQFKVRLYDQSNNEIDCKTTDVLDKRSFLMDISGSKIENVSGGYFLHGQEVDDFHNIDKAAIFTVVTAAVQDIDRIVQAQTATQQADAAKIAALEEQLASQDARIAALEQAIAALLAK